jgi:hypothetical protein
MAQHATGQPRRRAPPALGRFTDYTDVLLKRLSVRRPRSSAIALRFIRRRRGQSWPMLAEETDEAKRLTLLALLAEEEAKLAGLPTAPTKRKRR